MNKITTKKHGFTLIEIVIVIVIMGVLATLALPRFFLTVEFARSLEAMNIMASAKRAADRCSIMGGSGVDYSRCLTFQALAMDVPGLIPGTHFCYTNPSIEGGNWTIMAERNNVNNTGPSAACNPDGTGTGVGDTITLQVAIATGAVTRSGTGAFAGIR